MDRPTRVRPVAGGYTAAAPAGAEVSVRNHPAEMSVNFSPDILSILTTKGCNGSGCHGSPVGQNGFKLSLFGYDGAADYQMIVKAQDGRRVNLQDPVPLRQGRQVPYSRYWMLIIFA